MNKLVKSFIVLIVFVVISTIQAQECNVSKNDISLLIEDLKNNSLHLSDQGFFMDLQSPTFYSSDGKKFTAYLKHKGVSNVIFEKKSNMKYLLSF